MKVIVSAGISPILRYPNDDFINCFENYGNMFAKFEHEVWYVGLPSVQQNLEMILSADLWISEFNTFYIPLYLMILESGKMTGKTILVQHGSYDEMDNYSRWGLETIRKADGFIANTVHTKRILSNVVETPVYDDISQPIDDRMFSMLNAVEKKDRLLIGHVGGGDPRRHQLFAASIFNNYPITIITDSLEYAAKFNFHKDVEFSATKKDGIEYYTYLASHKYFASVSSIPTLGRDMILAAVSGTVSISSPYFYQTLLFPSTTAWQFSDFYNIKNIIGQDNSNIQKIALANARQHSFNAVYERFMAKL